MAKDPMTDKLVVPAPTPKPKDPGVKKSTAPPPNPTRPALGSNVPVSPSPNSYHGDPPFPKQNKQPESKPLPSKGMPVSDNPQEVS